MRLWMVVLTGLAALPLAAAPPPRGEPWYSFYVEDRMGDWEAQLTAWEAQPSPPDGDTSLARLSAAYGFIGWCLGQKLNDKAARHLDWAEQAWAAWNRTEGPTARVLALKAGLTGFQLSLRPWEAPVRGPQSQEAARQAVKLDPAEPLGWWELGHVDYYAPTLLGGSPERARDSFDRALRLWEAAPGGGAGDWGYLQAASDAVRVRVRLGLKAEAEALWDKLLAREPRLAKQPFPRP